MSHHRTKPKHHTQPGSRPGRRRYLYLVLRIIFVIVQLLVVAAHRDQHGAHDERSHPQIVITV